MREPVTTIDQRYGDEGFVATPWAETQRALEAAQLFWLTTIRPEGGPQVTPLVAVWSDGALSFSTGVAEQKVLNLRANPHVALTTGRNDWDTGTDVVVEGEAVRITDQAALEHLAQVWTAKWDGRWQYRVRDGYFYHGDGEMTPADSIHVYSVTPSKVYAFGKGGFSQTRYQF